MTQKPVQSQLPQGGFSTFKRKAAPYVFTGPFYILFLIFGTYPIFYSLYLSFHSWNGIGAMQFVGFRNYYSVLSDYLFWRSLLNTFVMMLLTGVPQHVVAIFFAFILNQGLVKLKEFFRIVLFIPYLTSSVAIALIFGVLYGTQYGIINFFLLKLQASGLFPFHLPIEWFKESTTWISLSFITFWRWTGWNALLYLAGLQAIHPSLYEAARIDGAGSTKIFFHITLPLLKPVIYFATTMSIIGGMQYFDEPMVMITLSKILDNGGFGQTSSIYMYAWAFAYGKFGLATATSYLLCFIIMALSLIHRRFFKEK